MIIPDPNLAFRTHRRADVHGFERLLRLAIERCNPDTGERPVSPTGIEPASLDDLARITHEATTGSYRLEAYGTAPYSGLILPWSLYEQRDGDIFVFGSSAKLKVQLTERRGHNTYSAVNEHTVAEPGADLGFLYRLDDALHETVQGDLVLVKPARLRYVAQAVVRPKRNADRALN